MLKDISNVDIESTSILPFIFWLVKVGVTFPPFEPLDPHESSLILINVKKTSQLFDSISLSIPQTLSYICLLAKICSGLFKKYSKSWNSLHIKSIESFVFLHVILTYLNQVSSLDILIHFYLLNHFLVEYLFLLQAHPCEMASNIIICTMF